VPAAKQLVNAANASNASGVTQLIEEMTSLMGHGRADLNILAEKLSNLSLTEDQIKKLLIEVLARANILIGPTVAAKIKEILPAPNERSGHD
jgi:hypothetical protein